MIQINVKGILEAPQKYFPCEFQNNIRGIRLLVMLVWRSFYVSTTSDTWLEGIARQTASTKKWQ